MHGSKQCVRYRQLGCASWETWELHVQTRTMASSIRGKPCKDISVWAVRVERRAESLSRLKARHEVISS